MNHILFVDDEINILNGLKRMLRPMRDEWLTIYVESGEQALEELSKQNFDIIVTDSKMPGMNGYELLSQVKEKYPEVIRIGLPGQNDEDTLLHNVDVTHQQLAKPCEHEALINTINQALLLKKQLSNKEIVSIISKITSLPSLPVTYDEVIDLSNNPSASIKDFAMSAKIMQLVNSAFFDLPRHVSSVEEAIGFLGIDILKALILNIEVISFFEKNSNIEINIDELQKECLLVSSLGKYIAKSEGLSKEYCDYAAIAGLLHDIGIYILLVNFSKEYEKVIEYSEENKESLWKSEELIFGCSHMDTGADLLGLWGFKAPIIEAIKYHHNPAKSEEIEVSPLTAVHIAEVIVSESMQKPRVRLPFDDEYLQRVNIKERLPAYQQYEFQEVANI